MRHGNGKIVYQDGSSYEGDWQNGSPYGFGVFITFSKERSLSVIKSLNKFYEKKV